MNRNVLDREPVVTEQVALWLREAIEPIREMDGIVGREHIRARVADLLIRFTHEQVNQSTLDDEPTEPVGAVALIDASEILTVSLVRIRAQLLAARTLTEERY